MSASKVMLLSYSIMKGWNQKPHYAPVRIQCENALVDKGKYDGFCIVQGKLITLYSPINHV